MYLAPLNYDRFFRKVFSDPRISQRFLEDFLDVEIEEFQILDDKHRITDDASIVEFDFRCKINGAYVIVDMQQWYKRDIGQRFYLYHALNTGLQLDKIPEKFIVTDADTRQLKKIKDYSALEPVLTLVWMVDDSLGFRENFVSYVMTPELVIDFIRDEKLWHKPDIREILEKRAEAMEALQNQVKGLSFISSNRLIFLLQGNIVKNKSNTRYERWFTFAERSKKANNVKKDFDEFKGDEIFTEIIRRLNKSKLEAEDLVYIEDQKKYWEGVNRLEQGFYNEGKKDGEREGIKKGIKKGIIEGIKEGEKNKAREMAKKLKEKGNDISFIADISGLTPDEIDKLKSPVHPYNG